MNISLQQFVDAFNARVHESVRIVNYHDYVPCNPMQRFGYQHVKGGVVIKVNTGRISRNHNINEAYFPGLLANVPEYLENKIKKKYAKMSPPLPEMLPDPSWEEEDEEGQGTRTEPSNINISK